MDQVLEAALDQLGLTERTKYLRQAADFSAGIVADSQEFLSKRVPPGDPDVDVLIFGSYARGEASHTSDFDYLIVPHALPAQEDVRVSRDLTHAVQELMASLAKTNNLDSKAMQPGATGVFGTIQSAVDLVERIGLEQDTNTTHTRRCLLLQESVSIYRPDLREKLLETVLARYLADYPGREKPGAPRFLLNDLNRYWFTVAVDYQAKRWERLDVGWGIRYLKLLVTRRISHVAGVLPLLLCSEVQPASVGHLVSAYTRPALSRLADLVTTEGFDRHDDLATTFVCVSDFLATLSDEGARGTLNHIAAKPESGEYPIFDTMRVLTVELDGALRRIFDGELLRPLVNRYLIL